MSIRVSCFSVFLSELCFRARGGVRVKDRVGFRVRVGIRSRVRARCGFGFICFSSSKLELNICLCGGKTSDGIEFPNITGNLRLSRPSFFNSSWKNFAVMKKTFW